jgi:HD-like signal output (HDOD) protein
MDKNRKLELIQRSLGIRHKLKVHESLKSPDTHEELSLMLLSRWELEDELKAIEDLLAEARNNNVTKKKESLAKNGPIKEADPKRRVLEALASERSSSPS